MISLSAEGCEQALARAVRLVPLLPSLRACFLQQPSAFAGNQNKKSHDPQGVSLGEGRARQTWAPAALGAGEVLEEALRGDRPKTDAICPIHVAGSGDSSLYIHIHI